MAFAFLFPGQGAQKLNMMSGFTDVTIVKKTFDESSKILDLDLWALINGEDVQIINKTIITQPLLLTVEIAIYNAYLEAGGKQPDYFAGHSLGEYSALVAAQALNFSDAVRLVRTRAELMQSAIPEGSGTMAAILGLSDEDIRQVCEEVSAKDQGLVQAANYNSMNQVVIAGKTKAVELAMEMAKEKGAKRVIPLPVSVPSHCQLMQPAAEKLAKTLADIEIKKPKSKVIHNVDIISYNNPDDIKDALVRQLYSPVRWTETILSLLDCGINITVECAPAKVLTDLNKRISKEMTCTPFMSMDTVNKWIQVNQ
ncbi:MAG: ACP S-malonyltransferase [Neisseriaceae bacterium]|nr:MAG: ACP S-malonyltransferase [Neisseriaceae bacterium]